MGNIIYTETLANGDNQNAGNITNMKNDITAVVNGAITNSNIGASASIVFSKFSTGAATSGQVFKADGASSGSFSAEGSFKHARKGFTLKAGTTADSDINVTPGSIDVGGTIVTTVADNGNIAIATDANWIDGTAPGLTSIFIYVVIDSSGNILLTESAPNLSYTDDTTAEFPMRYRKQGSTYYRYLGAVFSDAADDLTWGHNGSEGLYVSQFDASNCMIIAGLGTGADQTFSTIWTPKWIDVIYGAFDATPAAGETVPVFHATQKMLDTNWYGTQLNVAHLVAGGHQWAAITTAGSVNAFTSQAAGTAGSFTIDAMTDNFLFYAIAHTDIL